MNKKSVDSDQLMKPADLDLHCFSKEGIEL